MGERVIGLDFDPLLPMPEVEATLGLARLAAECIHGAERVRLEARCVLYDSAHAAETDVAGRAGRTLALVFTGYLRREFGQGAVRLRRVGARQAPRESLVASPAAPGGALTRHTHAGRGGREFVHGPR